MTFVGHTFSNGDYLSATTMNEIDGDIDHVREEGSYRTIFASERVEARGRSDASPYIRLRIDTTLIGTQQSAVGNKSEGDIDISSFSDGVHTLTVVLGDSTGSNDACSIRFIKTPDIDYITYWATLADATFPNDYLVATPSQDFPTDSVWLMATNVTVIGHRESKSWV